MAFGISQDELDDALAEGQERVRAGFAPDDKGTVQFTPHEEAHLVEYVTECVRESFESTEERRLLDQELWRAHESEMPEYADKEAWQSKIVINRPFATAYQAASIVRRGVIQRRDWFELTPQDPENEAQVIATDFWREALRYWTTRDHVKLPYELADASHLSFAVGASSPIKFLWKPDEDGNYGLHVVRFEPWKEYADPDRKPRRPWSGLYAIHEEWVDLHELEAQQEKGHYQNVEKIDLKSLPQDDASYWRHTTEQQREEDRNKHSGSHKRNKFRHPILVREFWGTVLDASGRLLYKNLTYTVAGNQVIRKPIVTPFPGGIVRWPWVGFSTLPHPMRFHGYGLYEGVLAIWKLQCQLLNLYLDNENFRINTMFELDPSKLRNPADDEVFPGKKWIRKVGAMEGPAINPVRKAESNLSDVQFMWSLAISLWENGSFVTEFVKGEQGSRRDITATEVQQKTQQAMGVFDSIGGDVEEGGIDILKCAYEVLRTFWFEMDRAPFQKIVRTNPLAQAIQQGLMPEDRMRAMAMQAQFRVAGVSKAFEKAQIIAQLRELAELGKDPTYAGYVKHYDLVKQYAEELSKPNLVLTPEELQAQQMSQQNLEIGSAMDQVEEQALAKAGLAPVGKTIPGPGVGKPQPKAQPPASGNRRPSVMPPGTA